ncbi:MAG TPA: acyl carrier protein [Actinocrinis sp.]|nr:acyl carrier protein [Actinocrinis sp.]
MSQLEFDQFVARICDVKVTDPEASLVQLGVDSLRTINLVMAVEDEYGVEIDPDILADDTLSTPAGLWRYVQEHSAHATAVG